jgi:hypothetical protein
MVICVFAHLRIQVVRVPKKSQKNNRRHHLKKKILSVLLRVCIFVFKSKKSQPKKHAPKYFIHSPNLSLTIFEQRVSSSVLSPLSEEAPLFVFSPLTMLNA